MKKIKVLLVALLVTAGLLTLSTPAQAAFPVASGGLQGSYIYCAPGQNTTDCYNAIGGGLGLSCIVNQDFADQNVGFGFGTYPYPFNTYQAFVMRKWMYCGKDLKAKANRVVVGPGYCMHWQRWVTKVTIPSGAVQVYGVLVASGTAHGSSLVGNMYRLSTANNTHYVISGYRC